MAKQGDLRGLFTLGQNAHKTITDKIKYKITHIYNYNTHEHGNKVWLEFMAWTW